MYVFFKGFGHMIFHNLSMEQRHSGPGARYTGYVRCVLPEQVLFAFPRRHRKPFDTCHKKQLLRIAKNGEFYRDKLICLMIMGHGWKVPMNWKKEK